MTLAVVEERPVAATPKEYLLFIDGQWTPGSDGSFDDDINPATGEVFARVARGPRHRGSMRRIVHD